VMMPNFSRRLPQAGPNQFDLPPQSLAVSLH